MFKKLSITLVFISFLFTCQEKETAQTKIQILPIPDQLVKQSGSFEINNGTTINYTEEFSVSATFLSDYLTSGTDINLTKSNTSGDISFVKDESLTNDEAYSLNVSSEGILISAKTDKGAFYAIQSLRQLLPVGIENNSYKQKTISVPNVSIEDAPAYGYRGLMLDVGRHMFPVEFIKKYIDAMAMLKMNTFHWHLTEDQGWRIEIKQYPKLQEVAAYRKETLIGHFRDQPHQWDGKRYGGYYTQEEVKNIVAYAQSRHITVIPEIELPGHSQAAIAAYPELGCTDEQLEVATVWGVHKNVYCPKETTFEFLENVLDEVIALFPSEYIHIGGDEAPKDRWEACSNCQSLIKKEGLHDEHELQSYFISRIEKYLNSKGRQIIGWDEILEGGLAPNATVMSWRGINGAIEAAKQDHDVIMTPNSHMYLDYYQSEDENEPLAIGGFLPLKTVYSFNPIPKELTKEQAKYVLGVQGNVWTEYIPSAEKVEYMTFPRAIAISEIGWSKPENQDYTNFVSRLEHLQKRLTALNINFANHLDEIKGTQLNEDGKMSYTLTTHSSYPIRYTTDGSKPTIDSPKYEKSIPLTKSMTIKAMALGEGKETGRLFTKSINIHKAVGKSIKLSVPPNKRYTGSGATGLINGIRGNNKRFNDEEWLGFRDDKIEITIDLGKETEIESLDMRFHNGKGSWIFAPKTIGVSIDNAEDVWFDIAESNDETVNTNIPLKRLGQVLKVTLPSYGPIPDWHTGAGGKPWTFIDEIIVN
jgi:hexosaminidase